MTASWVDEFRFLKALPGYTHGGESSYLDADPRFVRWMLEIDRVTGEAQAAAAERAGQ